MARFAFCGSVSSPWREANGWMDVPKYKDGDGRWVKLDELGKAR